MSKWKEIKNSFIDEDENVVCIDAWKTNDENEEGKVIAKVDITTKEVTYLDESAKTDRYAQEVIKDAIARIEKDNVSVILVELDNKGYYERFALTPEEFQKEFPKAYENFAPIEESNSITIRPLVHIWFEPCKVGDEKWNTFFTDMKEGLPESDIDSGNLAYIREDLFKSLKEYLPENTKINYLYRDASNYKVYNSAVVAGKITDEQENQIMKAINIKWDIEEGIKDVKLPTEIEIPKGMTDLDDISDYISDVTGFCHEGFELVESLHTYEKEKKPSLLSQIQNAEAKTTVSELANLELKSEIER